MREKCEQTEHCVHTRERLVACETRVGSHSETTEDCTEELFDFLHARDHCVSATELVSSLQMWFEVTHLTLWRSLTKNINSIDIYSLVCHSKLVCCYFYF